MDVEYRCFFGGLAWADSEAPAGHFSMFGEIFDSKVINDRETKSPRGFGFVTFAEEKSTRDVIEEMSSQSRGSDGGGKGGGGGGSGGSGGYGGSGGGGGYGGGGAYGGGGGGYGGGRRDGGYTRISGGGGYGGGGDRGYGGGGGGYVEIGTVDMLAVVVAVVVIAILVVVLITAETGRNGKSCHQYGGFL